MSKLANDFGTGPDNWFSSSWSLLKFLRLPSSSGKLPDNLFPFKSLHGKYIRIITIHITTVTVRLVMLYET